MVMGGRLHSKGWCVLVGVSWGGRGECINLLVHESESSVCALSLMVVVNLGGGVGVGNSCGGSGSAQHAFA